MTAESPNENTALFVERDILNGPIVPLVRLRFDSKLPAEGTSLEEESVAGVWVLGYVSGTTKYGVRYIDRGQDSEHLFSAGIRSGTDDLQEMSLVRMEKGTDVWLMDGDEFEVQTGLPNQDPTNPKVKFYPDNGDIEDPHNPAFLLHDVIEAIAKVQTATIETDPITAEISGKAAFEVRGHKTSTLAVLQLRQYLMVFGSNEAGALRGSWSHFAQFAKKIFRAAEHASGRNLPAELEEVNLDESGAWIRFVHEIKSLLSDRRDVQEDTINFSGTTDPQKIARFFRKRYLPPDPENTETPQLPEREVQTVAAEVRETADNGRHHFELVQTHRHPIVQYGGGIALSGGEVYMMMSDGSLVPFTEQLTGVSNACPLTQNKFLFIKDRTIFEGEILGNRQVAFSPQEIPSSYGLIPEHLHQTNHGGAHILFDSQEGMRVVNYPYDGKDLSRSCAVARPGNVEVYSLSQNYALIRTHNEQRVFDTRSQDDLEGAAGGHLQVPIRNADIGYGGEIFLSAEIPHEEHNRPSHQQANYPTIMMLNTDLSLRLQLVLDTILPKNYIAHVASSADTLCWVTASREGGISESEIHTLNLAALRNSHRYAAARVTLGSMSQEWNKGIQHQRTHLNAIPILTRGFLRGPAQNAIHLEWNREAGVFNIVLGAAVYQLRVDGN